MSEKKVSADWPDLSGRLFEGGHVLPVRVYYEDTDFTGVVYHASYLKFIERGRTDMLRLCGVHHHELDEGVFGERLAYVVRHMDVNFYQSARIDDVLKVVTKLEEYRGARIVLLQTITRGGKKLFEARVTIAVVSASGRPRRLPEVLANRLKIAEAP